MPDLARSDADRGFVRRGAMVFFDQLGLKVDLQGVSTGEYFDWLDSMTQRIGRLVPGAAVVEKPHARLEPVVDTGVYYDTDDRQLLGTGSLLRTTSAVTHAFCAFKRSDDGTHVRKDHRYVFEDPEKSIIQADPASPEAVRVVRDLLARTDIEHPGVYLYRHHGLDPTTLSPSVLVRRRLCSFYVWLDGRDALRCPMDRVTLENLREPHRPTGAFREVELAIYPRAEPAIARDPRLTQLIEELAGSLRRELGAPTTPEIKYQRAGRALGIFPVFR
jgi:hypothetical protein